MPTDVSRRALVPRTRPAVLPLSFAQRRLWFLNRLEGLTPNYNEPVALRITGPLDRAALISALEDLVERHETLRTVFPESGGTPRQQIIDAASWRPWLEILDTPPADLHAAVAGAVRQRFDLTVETPIRAHLFVLRPDDHVLLLVMHHIAMDGWSVQRVLIRDLVTAYQARCSGKAPALPHLPLQYADYALWQLEMLGNEDDSHSTLARQLAFWKNALADLPEQLPLATDRPRPAVSSLRGAVVPLSIDRDLHQRLVTLARHERATIFMVLQAGLATVLTRWGAGTDIPVGTPVSGRKTSLVGDLVGFFANTIVLRTDTSGNPTFRGLLARVRRTVLEACAHDDLPFERIVEALSPSRSLSRNPLFQVMIGLQRAAPAAAACLGATRIERVPIAIRTHARFDLAFDFADRRAADGRPLGIGGKLQFSTDLFDQSTADRLAAALVNLLRSVVANADQRIEQIDLLSANDRQQVLQEWIATERAIPEPLVPTLVGQHAARTPHATAVVCEQQCVDYQALNEQANRIAWYLIAQGVGPEDVIAVAVPRSVELVTCLLGVLKAGAAYLPLDPEHAAGHLAFMLDDAKPRCVLTTSDVMRALPMDTRSVALDTPHMREALAHCATDNPSQRLHADNAAYVVYTAGTTGRPHPVVVTHRGLSNLLTAMQEVRPISTGDRLLAVTTAASDLAALELFGPLVSGAVLILAPAHDVLYPGQLARGLADRGATVVQATPHAVRAIANYLDRPLPGLTFLIGRGTLSNDLARELRHLGHAVVNLYGTSETTIWNTSAVVEATESSAPWIGRPICNTRVYVLDRHLRPVPIGVVGELYVGGAGLARGYLTQPALTATRFVGDPYGPRGARMFRTGDRARWKPQGQLELMGRVDEQTQIGRTVLDLGVIESIARDCHDVGDAAAAVQQAATGEPHIVAYVVAARGRSVDANALREQLARRLPKTLAPDVIVPLDRLPLTPNGTLDRRALPPPVFPAATRRWPERPEEQTLCALFADVLNISQVALDDNFFELGGHSLLVMTLINRVRTTLGIELDIRTVFDAPTVAGLVRRLDASRAEAY